MRYENATVAAPTADPPARVAADPLSNTERRFRYLLGAIALVALVGRVLYIVRMRASPMPPDGLYYHHRAQAIADGRGFVNPLIQQVLGLDSAPPDAGNPPAWSLVLAGASRFGLRSVLSHQLVAAVVGTATVIMTGLAGRTAFNRRGGLIAAALIAIYPNAWVYERELMSESLAMLGVATCIWLAYRLLARPTPGLVAALGVTVGMLAMTRSEQIALLLFLVLPAIVSLREIAWRRRVAWMAGASAVCLLVVAPWAVYNTARFEEPVILSTGLGLAMATGNCESTYSGDLLGYVDGGTPAYSCLPALVSSEASIADGELRRAAIEFMRDHSSRVPVVVAARIGRTFSLFRPFQQARFEAGRNNFQITDPDCPECAGLVRVSQLGLIAYWMLLPLAVLGAVFARRRRILIFPLLAFPLVVALSVTLTIGAVRYRAPAEVPLVLLAAFAIAVVTHRLARRPTIPAEPIAR